MFNVEKVDKAIESIADNISNGTEKHPEIITALAELIRARAVVEKEKYSC